MVELFLNGQYSGVFNYFIKQILVLKGLHDEGIEPCRGGAGVLRRIVCTVNSRFERSGFVVQKEVRSLRIDIA